MAMNIIISKLLYHTLFVEVADPSANKVCLHTLYIEICIYIRFMTQGIVRIEDDIKGKQCKAVCITTAPVSVAPSAH